MIKSKFKSEQVNSGEDIAPNNLINRSMSNSEPELNSLVNLKGGLIRYLPNAIFLKILDEDKGLYDRK